MTTGSNNITAETPVIFTDGSQTFARLKTRQLAQHEVGLFILAPSGAGKTHFVINQKDKNWIDGDELWPLCGADYTDDAWHDNFEEVMEINARCDIVTLQAKKQGLWVIGSSNLFLQPDAIVLPDWETHKAFIQKREQLRVGDGATSDDLEGVIAHREWIRGWMSYGVPCFESAQDAATYCTGLSEANTVIVGRS